MKYGICICGLNGSGKTTLAKVLAKELNFTHMDIEQYYFTFGDNPYSTSKTRKDVECLLFEDISKIPCFIFSAVNGNMSERINTHYKLVIYLEAPVNIRMKRIKRRAFDQFGNRINPGGDMYDQENAFFKYAEKRSPENIEHWLQALTCKVIRLDGTKPIQENIEIIKNIISQSDYFL